jgi:hypothetical protein
MRAAAAIAVLIAALAAMPAFVHGVAAGPAPLDLAAIQKAYEAAARTSGAAHIAGLVVRKADCAEDSEGRSLCWIRYTDDGDGHQRQKPDVISLERQGADWILTSGLCLPPRKT